MTRDDLIAALRALGCVRIPDPLPPFRTACACRTFRGTREELPAGHDWHQAHGGTGCTDVPAVVDVVGFGLRCDCGKGFGMNVDALRRHTEQVHGREATKQEHTPR